MTKESQQFDSKLSNVVQEQRYNQWLKQKVEKSIHDTRPMIPHDQVVAKFKKLSEESE